MCAERDPDRFAAASPEGDPEVIDVRRNAVGFSRESDRDARDVDDVSVGPVKITALGSLSASMWQRLRERWRRPAAGLFMILKCRSRQGVSSMREADYT